MIVATAVHGAAECLLIAMTGSELCVAAFVEPVLRSSDEALQRVLAPRFAALLGRVMPFWYATSLLLTGADWWLSRRAGAGYSALLQVLIVMGTIAVLVPVNDRIAKAQMEPGWMKDAQKWDRLHVARVVLLAVASGLLVFVG